MTELYATGIFLFVLFAMLGSSVWVGLALVGVAFVGMELFTSRPAGDAMITTIWTGASSWTLTALPLFIWMGEILYRTRLSEDMFRGLAPWMRWARTRLIAMRYLYLRPPLRPRLRAHLLFRQIPRPVWQARPPHLRRPSQPLRSLR